MSLSENRHAMSRTIAGWLRERLPAWSAGVLLVQFVAWKCGQPVPAYVLVASVLEAGAGALLCWFEADDEAAP
jgi:hypothetical protein